VAAQPPSPHPAGLASHGSQRRVVPQWRGIAREVLALWLAGTVLLALLIWTATGSSLGKRLYDRLVMMVGFQASPEVVMVAIDELSQRQLGAWPISRLHYAHLLKRMVDEGQAPAALGLDLLFTSERPADAELAEQMARLPVVLPKVLTTEALAGGGSTGPPRDPWQPIPPLIDRAGRATGHIHVRFESDGILRGIQTRLLDQSHFSLALLQAAGLAGRLPLPEAEYLRFPMVDPARGFTTYSLSDLIDPQKPLPALRGKVVLLGVTDPRLGDHHATIYSGASASGTPGVAILASAINAHLTGRWVRVVPEVWVFAVSLLTLTLVIAALQIWPARRLRLMSLTLGAGLPLGAVVGLLAWGWWFDVVALWLTLFALALVWVWRRLEDSLRYMRRKSRELQSGQVAASNEGGVGVIGKVELALDRAIELQGQQLDLLDQVIAHLPEAVAVIDAAGQVLQINERMQALGSGRIGQAVTLPELARELDLPSTDWLALSEWAKRAGQALRVPSANGPRDVHLKTSSFNASGAQGLRLLALIDVTELKQSQAQRDQALKFLSHDMRTPVASILAVCREMRTQPADLTNVDRVMVHANQLMRLMDGFLFESKAHVEQLALTEHLLDDLLEDAMAQVRDLAHARGMRIEFRHGERYFFLQVSAMLMVRVFTNLLLNAIKYGQPGTLVSISAEPGALESAVAITLSNQVAEQSAAVDDTIITKGFGLGLDFVRTVVQRHQGQLSMNIGHPKGWAHVCVTLPCSIEAQ
jgi:CHASE2 domain-containing sensor protein/signal transduction histidine kinase